MSQISSPTAIIILRTSPATRQTGAKTSGLNRFSLNSLCYLKAHSTDKTRLTRDTTHRYKSAVSLCTSQSQSGSIKQGVLWSTIWDNAGHSSMPMARPSHFHKVAQWQVHCGSYCVFWSNNPHRHHPLYSHECVNHIPFQLY